MYIVYNVLLPFYYFPIIKLDKMRHFRSFSIIIIESMHMSLTKPMLALIIRKLRYLDMGIFMCNKLLYMSVGRYPNSILSRSARSLKYQIVRLIA